MALRVADRGVRCAETFTSYHLQQWREIFSAASFLSEIHRHLIRFQDGSFLHIIQVCYFLCQVQQNSAFYKAVTERNDKTRKENASSKYHNKHMFNEQG